RGYYTKPDPGVPGYTYVPVTHATLLDSTLTATSSTTPTCHTFPALGIPGIPNVGVAAMALNVIANNATSSSGTAFTGQFTLYADVTKPHDSIVNFRDRQTVTHFEVVDTLGADATGKLTLCYSGPASSSVRAVVRVRGYFGHVVRSGVRISAPIVA